MASFLEIFWYENSACALDLRYILSSLGYSGGLKACERQLGVRRSGILADVDGFFAILLWNEYNKSKNIRALETLLAYNIEDVLNLERLMVKAYNKKLRSVPFKLTLLDIPKPPCNPFKVNAALVDKIKAKYY